MLLHNSCKFTLVFVNNVNTTFVLNLAITSHSHSLKKNFARLKMCYSGQNWDFMCHTCCGIACSLCLTESRRPDNIFAILNRFFNSMYYIIVSQIDA